MNRPKKFILTLYEIINDPQNAGVIDWTDTGHSFAIHNLNLLSSKVLPHYFKHRNTSSFIRQLNMYDFHKVRDTGDVIVYTHPDFIQDMPERLLKVRRKSSVLLQPSSKSEKKLSLMSCKHKCLIERVEDIEQEMKQINENNTALVSQLEQFCDRQRKLEQIILMFIQQVKEFPTAFERIYVNVMGRNNGSACFNGYS